MSESDKFKEEALDKIHTSQNTFKLELVALTSITYALLYIGSVLDKHLSTIAKNTKK